MLSFVYGDLQQKKFFNFFTKYFLPYLNTGTGNAWAWQRSAKVEYIGARLENVCTSPEKAGAFEPIGSGKYLLLKRRNGV